MKQAGARMSYPQKQAIQKQKDIDYVREQRVTKNPEQGRKI